MKCRPISYPSLGLLVAALALLLTPSLSSRAFGEEKKNLPPRAISVAPEYTGIVVAKGENVSVDLNVVNGGQKDESIDVTLTNPPKGWNARIKTYSFGVTGIFVPSDKAKSLTLKLDPEEGVAPGKYTFHIHAQTQDGKLTSDAQLVLTLKEGEKEKEDKGVNITTSYPVLKGPTDGKFEFSIEVENKTDKEAIFNLNAQGPENWEINFKPTYEEKYFSSLRIKQGASQTVAVSVKPNVQAEPGKYPIKVKVSSDTAKAEADLQVILTGTYKVEMGTPNGLLSLTAIRGKEANISFYIRNNGSAPQSNVRFLSVKPENWKAEFKPDKLETLPPGELKQIELTITPSDQALVGDYSVAVSMEGEKVQKNLEFRVTVKASTAWGWVGIGIIVVVLGGLVTLFTTFGRR